MSIRKIGKNKYKIEIEKKVDQERIRKSKTITVNLKGNELKAFLNQEEINLIAALNNSTDLKSQLSNFTFKEFAEYHIKNKQLEQQTIDWYNKYLNNRTYDFFEGKKITEITKIDINNFFNFLKNVKSEKTNKTLAAKTIKHYKTILHAIFESAYNLEIIQKNFVNDINIQSVKSSLNDKFYSPEEVNRIIYKLSNYEDKSLLLIFSLSVTCGLRPAELRGLTWDKINFKNKEILIDRSLTATSKGNVFKTTKTNDSRKLVLTDNLIILLKEHKINELNKKAEFKIDGDINKRFVFTSPRGFALNPKTVNLKWKEFCKKNDIRYISQYGFRHTTATMLAFNNIPLPNISKHMGHSNFETTQIYIHAVDEMNDKIKDIFEVNTTSKIRLIK